MAGGGILPKGGSARRMSASPYWRAFLSAVFFPTEIPEEPVVSAGWEPDRLAMRVSGSGLRAAHLCWKVGVASVPRCLVLLLHQIPNIPPLAGLQAADYQIPGQGAAFVPRICLDCVSCGNPSGHGSRAVLYSVFSIRLRKSSGGEIPRHARRVAPYRQQR